MKQTFVRPTMTDLAWAAGLFEGEGCILTKNYAAGKTSGICIKLTTTDEDVIRRFNDIVGIGNVYGPYKNGKLDSYKPVFEWKTEARGPSVRLLFAFYPFLGKRRRSRVREVFRFSRIWFIN